MKTANQLVVTQLPPRLSLTGTTKRYPSVIASDGVSLTIAPDEIHAVLGENGVDRSTLMKMIFGAVQPDAGEILLSGQRVEAADPYQAHAFDIAMAFQHFSLFDTSTAAGNILLGLPSDTGLRDVADQVRNVGEKYSLPLEPYRHVYTPSVGERQYMEIVRTLLTGPRLLVPDEPASVLTPQAVGELFATLRQLAVRSMSIPYIDHELSEVQALYHTTTVMRTGKVIGVCDPYQETAVPLSHIMVDGEPPRELRPQTTPGDVRTEVIGLSLPKAYAFATELRDIALQLRSGEVVGIADVSGSGQQELLAALPGEDMRASAQIISIGNEPTTKLDPQAHRRRGLSFVPEERLGHGAVPSLPLAANMPLTHQRVLQVREGLIDKKTITKLVADVIQHSGVRAAGLKTSTKSLSGDNLQKLIVGREIECALHVLIVARPTWDVNMGAAAQIHNEILALKTGGCTILIVLERLNESLAFCDRLHAIANGRLSPSTPMHAINHKQIGLWIGGIWSKTLASAAAASEMTYG